MSPFVVANKIAGPGDENPKPAVSKKVWVGAGVVTIAASVAALIILRRRNK